MEKELPDCRGADHPTSGVLLDPYLTPEDSPPPPGALLAATIRGPAFTEATIGKSSVALEVEESIASAIASYPPDPWSGIWRTAFNAGRLVTPLGTIRGEVVSKVRYTRAVKARRPVVRYPNREYQRTNRPISPEKGMSEPTGPENSPSNKPKSPKRLKSRYRRDLPPPPKTHRDLGTYLLGAEFREVEKAYLKTHQESRTWCEVSRTSGQQGILDCM